MALMESPAIIVAVLLYRLSSSDRSGSDFSWSELWRDAFFNGSVFLIMGSLVIGVLSGEAGAKALKPFTSDIFTGVLCFFLLDMGIVAAKRLCDLKKAGVFLAGFGILLPLANAAIAIPLAYALGLSQGDAFMFTVLCASASYIAVPAACVEGAKTFNTSIGIRNKASYTPSPATLSGNKVMVKIYGGTGDADLYVKKGSAPTTSSYDCRPYTSSNTETCDMSSLGAGTYYIMVYGYLAVSGLTLERYHACATTNQGAYGDACANG